MYLAQPKQAYYNIFYRSRRTHRRGGDLYKGIALTGGLLLLILATQVIQLGLRYIMGGTKRLDRLGALVKQFKQRIHLRGRTSWLIHLDQMVKDSKYR